MIRTPSILAVSEHTGWAYVVCLSARDRRPCVITRRRIALIDRGLPTHPYEHETRAMPPEEAEALLANVRNSMARTTDVALGRLVDELSREHPVTTLTIRKPPFEKLPASVAAVQHHIRCCARLTACSTTLQSATLQSASGSRSSCAGAATRSASPPQRSAACHRRQLRNS